MNEAIISGIVLLASLGLTFYGLSLQRKVVNQQNERIIELLEDIKHKISLLAMSGAV